MLRSCMAQVASADGKNYIDRNCFPQNREPRLSRNMNYQTSAIADYFGANRRQWEQFYPSERWLIDHAAARRNGRFGRVLDVGCAAGGLAVALGSRFDVTHYTGIDINAQAIEVARRASDIRVPRTLLAGDVMGEQALSGQLFDTVFNLSCADWNVDFAGILDASWARVAPGGMMILSLRLTEGKGERDFARSNQPIHYGDAGSIPVHAETAAYVVLNVSEALGEMTRLGPSRITAYGYWGPPSETARTPFTRLCFTVLAVEKPDAAIPDRPELELHLPGDVWQAP